MSLFSTHSITCAKCGHIYTMDVVGSVNADRRPDLRQAILDASFQEAVCPECAESFRMAPEFTYVDAAHGQWILSLPAEGMAGYGAAQVSAAALFDRSYGAEAADAARDVGAGLAPRLTFGWPAVREKVLIGELGLDDVVVELMKIDLLRRVSGAPLRPGVEQRLVGMDEGRLRFEWLGSADEAVISGLTVGRELYDVIAADTSGWAELHALLTDGCFVDMQKTYMGDGKTVV